MAQGRRPGPPGEPGWRAILRIERRRLGLTQRQLAERAGVATETLRKYESGDRTPSRASLERLLAALAVPQATVRAVFGELGFATADTLFGPHSDPDYNFTIPQMQAFADEVPWPQFGVNNVLEVVCANRAAEILWGIDFEAEMARRSRAQLNFMAITAERRFSQRIVNWQASMARVVGVLKAIPQSASLLDSPDSLFGEVFATFAKNDPTAIPKLFALWERTPPATAKVRWNYPITWREPGFDDIRLLGVVTTASEPDALAFNDWIPIDAASHATLERIIATRTATPSPQPPPRQRHPR